MTTMDGREIEVKLHLDDLGATRRALRRIGAKAEPRLFERNILYDTPTSELRETGRLLRIRIELPVASGLTPPRIPSGKPARSRKALRGILTFKAPVTAAFATTSGGRSKEREELEVEFRPAETLEGIFAGLGFHPGFRYEKFRTTYRVTKLPGLHLDLDETPLGNYLELEGAPAAIDRAAYLLGFAAQDYITATYWELHVAECRGRRETPGDLLFHLSSH
ncbi:MAG: class IV adenylate cyclase [Candidatus Acidiferrales bacterium]